MLTVCLRRAVSGITALVMAFVLLLSIAGGSGWTRTAKEALDQLQQKQLEAIASAYETDEHNLALKLAALGYTDVNGFSADHVSAQALLIHAAKRAEAGNSGDGKRLLAFLARGVQANSAIAASDPALVPLNAYSPASLAMPFTFSTDHVRVDAIKLPEAVERAAIALADHGWPHANMSSVLLRSLHKTGFTPLTLDLIAKDSPSLLEYLRRAIHAGSPPPKPADAVLAIISEVQAASAIAVNDPALNAIRSELSAPLPSTYEAMRNHERFTPTARVEYAAIQTAARREKLPIAALVGWGGQDPGGLGDLRPTDPPEGPPPFSGALAIDGDGSAATTGEHAKRAQAAYKRWDDGTFGSSIGGVPNPRPPSGPNGGVEGGDGGAADLRAGNDRSVGGLPGIGNPTSSTERSPSFRARISRAFSSASRSIRGPGGISLGAQYTSDILDRPVQVRWLPKPNAPQFGYLLVTMQTDRGGTYSALSRVLYAESADAAQRAVFGVGGDKSFALKEKDILPLVSMTAEASDQGTRAVVVNPALAGLKLAWSAVRADFWLPSFEGVLTDVRVLKPDVNADAASADAKRARAATWQIRERPFLMKLVNGHGLARILSCNDRSSCDAESYPPGFEIALFVNPGPLAMCLGGPSCTPSAQMARDEALAELIRPTLVNKYLEGFPPTQPGARQMAEALTEVELGNLLEWRQRPSESYDAWVERLRNPDLQEPGSSPSADAGTRYIGWLTQNHPDFIRLNDFHHALAITRWLASHKVSVQPLGPLYAPRSYPIPNRIRLSAPGLPPEAFVADPPE